MRWAWANLLPHATKILFELGSSRRSRARQ
jgi:hypothetical protein